MEADANGVRFNLDSTILGLNKIISFLYSFCFII